MKPPRKIGIGDRVRLHYRLTCRGQEIANTFNAAPEIHRIGVGDIDPRLEALLIGLDSGDHRTFELPPGAAFGDHDATLLHQLARDEFAPDLQLSPGHDVAFTLPNGQILHGIIRSVDDQHVSVDFNHPLAGLPVVFEVEILGIETD
jgi:FKBP-type peptidyl-prolyl cis-trans isomerase SlpA